MAKSVCCLLACFLLLRAVYCLGTHGDVVQIHIYSEKEDPATLVETITGKSFGRLPLADEDIGGGEIVFSTAMTGYVESMTDPSYAGQILLLSYRQFSQRLRRQAIDANVNVFTQINLVETILAAIQKNPSPLLS